MSFYVVALGFIAVCVAAIAVIVVRKFPQLTLIDAEALPQERETKKKKDIIHERVGRLTADWWKNFAARVSPLIWRLRRAFRRAYTKILNLDHHFQGKKPAAQPVTLTDSRASIEQMLREAEAAAKDGTPDQAEKKYIEIIKSDPKKIEAYRGLGDLYMEMKNYAQARETYAFLVKTSVRNCCLAHKGRACGEFDLKNLMPCPATPAIQGELARNYYSLAVACRSLGDLAGARQALEGAVAHESANPKHLDLLIETCILEGDKERAQAVYDLLKAANPDNQKLGSLSEKISAMPAKSGLNNSQNGKK